MNSKEKEREKWREYYRKYYCKHQDKLRPRITENYHKRRERIIKQLGGKCAVCNSTQKLIIHHLDYVHSQNSGQATLKELEKGKLILVCQRHHRAINFVNQLRRDGYLEKVMQLLNPTLRILMPSQVCI